MSPKNREQQAKTRRSHELVAGLVVLMLGAPLCFLFSRAMADGEHRRLEAPLRAMLGDASFEALSRGEKTETNYLGDGLSAPDFTLTDQDGKPWKLSDHRGKVLVLNFWTMTCQPCVEEMPSLVTLAAIAKARGDFEVVAVSADQDWPSVQPIFPPNSTLKVLFDPDRKLISGKYGTRLFPETWIIDADGVIRLRIDGARDWAAALSISAIERFF